MKLSFYPEAVLELEDAIFYYEDCQKVLGKQLNQEIKSAVKLITMHPEAWASLENNIRRMLVRRFPYGLLYTISNDEIIILAVMHLNCEPSYWKSRT
jgi:plasmid stabilization system protein ParE